MGWRGSVHREGAQTTAESNVHPWLICSAKTKGSSCSLKNQAVTSFLFQHGRDVSGGIITNHADKVGEQAKKGRPGNGRAAGVLRHNFLKVPKGTRPIGRDALRGLPPFSVTGITSCAPSRPQCWHSCTGIAAVMVLLVRLFQMVSAASQTPPAILS